LAIGNSPFKENAHIFFPQSHAFKKKKPASASQMEKPREQNARMFLKLISQSMSATQCI